MRQENTAQDISRGQDVGSTTLRVLPGGATLTSQRSKITREALFIALLLSVFQVADGVLTGIGMSYFGTQAEGNILLRGLMELFGYIPALVIAKVFALSIIAVLCVLTCRVKWLTGALVGVCAIYLFAAIIPWSVILFTHML